MLFGINIVILDEKEFLIFKMFVSEIGKAPSIATESPDHLLLFTRNVFFSHPLKNPMTSLQAY